MSDDLHPDVCTECQNALNLGLTAKPTENPRLCWNCDFTHQEQRRWRRIHRDLGLGA